MPDTERAAPGSSEAIREIAERIMGGVAYDQPAFDYADKPATIEWWKFGQKSFLREDWNPYTNPAHTAQVMERMRELGWNLSLRIACEYDCIAEFHCNYGPCEKHGNKKRNSHGVESHAVNWLTAVCEASRKTLETK
jgi:hypothetical protein